MRTYKAYLFASTCIV